MLIGNSTAGLSVRMSDHNNNYRVQINAYRGLEIIRSYSNPTGTIIASVRNITFLPDRWYEVSIYAKNRQFIAMVDNQTYATINEPSVYVSSGAFGFYLGASSSALFDDLSFLSDCVQTTMAARYMFERQTVSVWGRRHLVIPVCHGMQAR